MSNGYMGTPRCEHTDTTEDITLPQLRWRVEQMREIELLQMSATQVLNVRNWHILEKRNEDDWEKIHKFVAQAA